MQGAVGFLICIWLQIYQGIFQWKNFKICKPVKIWENYGHEIVAPFFGPPCRINKKEKQNI